MNKLYRNTFFATSILMMITGVIKAQDIHFSQFYNSPLTLNPALTGVNKCDMRLTANYRSQWASIASPYKTASVSFDSKFMQDKIFGRDFLGGGVVVVSDNSGGGALTVMKIMLSGSYHRYIDRDNKHTLGIGLQGSYVQKKIDPTKFRWPSQYPDFQYDASISSGEINLQDNLSFSELSIGVLHTFDQGEIFQIQSGVSLYHLNGPTETFLNDNSKLKQRLVVHTGGKIIANEKVSVVPHFFYMTQSKSADFNVGSAVEYTLTPTNLSEDIILSFGAWYRIKDAIMLVPGAEYKNWKLGLSYDINVSELREISNYRGGFELSLIWNLCKPTKPPVGPIIIPCGVF